MSCFFRADWLSASEPLPNINAYKCVPYIEKDGLGRYTCLLCSTGSMAGASTVRSHIKGSSHVRNYNLLRAKREWTSHVLSSSATVKSFSPRVEKLSLLNWRRHVNDEMLKYIMAKASFEHVHSLLTKYEKWEKLALLELIVWKHCCLSDGRFDSMQAIADYWALDQSFDSKAYKREARLSGAAGSIISCIQSFL